MNERPSESFQTAFYINDLNRLFSHSLQIIAAGCLINAQAEFAGHGKNVVENIGLYALVFRPHHRVGEAINFQRNAFVARIELAHHQRHVFADVAIVFQILLQISAESAQIGEVAAV